MEADTFPTKSKDSHSRKKRQAPYIIFPEILCIVDYDGYRYVWVKRLGKKDKKEESSTFFSLRLRLLNCFYLDIYFVHVYCDWFGDSGEKKISFERNDDHYTSTYLT